MCGVELSQTKKTLYNTKYQLKVRITGVFTNLNNKSVWKACGRFCRRRETLVEANNNSLEKCSV